MLSIAVERGLFEGISLGGKWKPVTHLQFADDTIIFMDESAESARGVKQVMQCFQLLSGLKINYDKSNVYSSRKLSKELSSAADIIKCKVGSWPMKYLGIPIGISAKRRIYWEPLIRKVQSRFSKWKAYTLNQVGKLTLVRSVLDSIPIYQMQLHVLPVTVRDKLEQIKRNFFWGNMDSNNGRRRKLHLIAWSKICQPRSDGGLGITLIRQNNLALLGKWHSRWAIERNRSWNKWI